MIKRNNVLITGVNGFIGSNLAKTYIQRGFHVIGVDIASVAVIPSVTYYQIDLQSEGIEEQLEMYEPAILIHCAGMADVNYSIIHPDSDFLSNVLLTRKVLYSIKEKSPETTVIYLSSAAVYGNPRSLPISEKCKLNPISPYALHKQLAEEICSYFVKQFEIDIRILRIFSAYGRGLKKQIFWDMGQKFHNEGRIRLSGTGAETRDFINICDLVDAIILIAEAPRHEEMIYNVANGIEMSIKEISEMFCRCLNKEVVVEFDNSVRKGNPNNWCANIEKLKQLGYSQKIDIYAGICDYVAWLNENHYLD